MILIGQFDSPFVRRVGIALTLYGLPFEHRPWSAFGDAEKIRVYNPLARVPTLVLDDGEVLIESHCILDYLDSLVPADRALFPTAEPARREALKIAALASGLGDKAVSLFYETRLHREVSEVWAGRCRAQIAAVLAVLEADRAGRTGARLLVRGPDRPRDTTVNPANGDEVIARSGLAAGLRAATEGGTSEGGLGYTRTVQRDESGRVRLEQWRLHGAGHAWSGGSPDGSYTDPRGPDASREMVRFFLQQSLPVADAASASA